MGKVDLVKLEEPKYDQACWDEMTKVVEDIKAMVQMYTKILVHVNMLICL